MWRRNNNNAEPQMGYPEYAESTMDERYLETIPEVESLYSRRSSVATNLPELPFRAVPPMTEQEYAYSNDVVAPTINTTFYSQQPSSLPTAHARSGSGAQASVSPISTQESVHANGSDISLVSPIDGSFPNSTHPAHSEKTARSQIPRKLPLPTTQKSPDDIPKKWSLREKTQGETRWDEYSGEPNQAGKPPSARPGALPQVEHNYPQLKERTRQILAGLKERDAVKKAGWGTASLPVEPDPLDDPVQRPPWKGASGRHAIVEPVKNTPSARTRPLNLQKRPKQAAEEAEPNQARSDTPDQPEPGPRSPIDAVSVAASRLPTIKPSDSEESIKPVVPLKLRGPSRVVSPTPNMSSDHPFQTPAPGLSQVYEAPPSPAPSSILEDGADSPTLGSARSFVASDRRRLSSESSETTVGQHEGGLQREQDTTSSWDTYATGTTEANTPTPTPLRQSPIPRARLTSSPEAMNGNWSPSTSTASVPESIVLRKRVAANNSGHNPYSYDTYYSNSISPYSYSTTSGRRSTSNILRKAVQVGNESPSSSPSPSPTPNLGLNHNTNTNINTTSIGKPKPKPRAISLMSNPSTFSSSSGKSLPPTPSELEAADKAASLQARLDDLSRRKRNLNKIIAELRESLKRNAIVYDARKRKEVDKMIINLGLELQDITNEEHETALRLHRVCKRRDKDDFYEQPTGLWIKRVTT